MSSLSQIFFSLVLPAITHGLPSALPDYRDYPTAIAGNPFVDGWYADPDAEYFVGRYWVFPTSSRPYAEQTYLDAFSSHDLVHWTKHANILTTDDVDWATRAIWAPAPITRDENYYLYFAANDIQEGQPEKGVVGGIGVAVSDKAEGPYKDALGKPLIGEYHNGAQPIDQDVFIDKHDNQAYILYGGHGHCNIAKLNEDMLSLGRFDDGTTFKEITPQGYVEGPQMIQRKGKYYLMWSEGSWTGSDYSVSYAMADSVLGPFIKQGKILKQDPAVAKGSGHNGVINIRNTDIWYIVYHRRPLSETNGNHRTLAYDRMYFNEDGTIAPVKMLVQDDFSDGDAVGWKQDDSGWSVVNQRLASSGPGVALLDTNFGDLVYDAVVSVPDFETHAGLVFRANYTSNNLTHLSGYYARISVLNGTTLEKIDNGVSSVLSQSSITTLIGTDEEYHIRVRAVGSEISVFVSDMATPKIAITDKSFSTGKDGVRASAAKAWFGFVSVAKP
ncbi:carbohydrate-binding module family 66 protein [Xylaria sp. CBS 124048]|nr:carbohydrate-binding module family 66 protein [Xylaria sp. CBS 124048]